MKEGILAALETMQKRSTNVVGKGYHKLAWGIFHQIFIITAGEVADTIQGKNEVFQAVISTGASAIHCIGILNRQNHYPALKTISTLGQGQTIQLLQGVEISTEMSAFIRKQLGVKYYGLSLRLQMEKGDCITEEWGFSE